MYVAIDDLLTDLASWMETEIPEARLKNDAEKGRPWFLKSIGYSSGLSLSELREIVNTGPLNEDFRQKYDIKDNKARKGISAIKAEISMLHSFKRSFVERHKTRMQYYADDLSQKSSRNMAAVGLSFGVFSEFRKNLEN